MQLRTGRIWRLLAAMIVLGSGLGAAASESPQSAPRPISAYCATGISGHTRPERTCIRLANYAADTCAAISRNASAFGLPRGYFARLIWQESHFDANAVSSAGAEGIAQFIPSTGRLQGLHNPYNPAEELYRAARYLKFLRGKFGNLGLAAAAYNGGENRVARFVSGSGYLAAETLDYVQTVTGMPIVDWLGGEVKQSDFALDDRKSFRDACLDLAASGSMTAFTPPTAIVQPWGIQLAQFFSSATARQAFTRLQGRYHAVLASEQLMLVAKRNPNFGRALRFTVEVGRGSRKAADLLCGALQKAGGACLVVRN